MRVQMWNNRANYSIIDLQESRDAYRARNEDHDGEWRCPGCQTKRTAPPGPYRRVKYTCDIYVFLPRTRCFCGAVVDPKSGRLATPHSCGQSCQRQRATCSHPCPLNCHPGPCPPCVATVQTLCHCSKTVSSMRCSHLTTTASQPSLSCGQQCGRQLQCDKHKCTLPCHPGICEPCEVVETGKCHCGKEEKTLACGEGDPTECADSSGRWVGRFTCQSICERCARSPYLTTLTDYKCLTGHTHVGSTPAKKVATHTPFPIRLARVIPVSS